MSIVAILAITAAVLLLLGRMPGIVGKLAGPHQMALALLLPLCATYDVIYAVFAACTIALILHTPTLGWGGLVLPAVGAIELRARLFVFALPMMPLLTKTLAISGLTLAQVTFVNFLSIGLLLAMMRAGLRLRISRLASWDILAATMMAIQIAIDARGTSATFAVRAALVVLLNQGLPYLAVSRAFHRARAPDAVLLSLVIAGCVLAMIAPFESIRHWLLYDSMPALAHADPDLLSGYSKQRDGLLRAHVTYGESTGLSLLFGLLIVIVVGLRRTIGSRWIAGFLIALLATGMLFTFARIGYIAIGAGLVACFVYERHWRNLATLVIALPAAVGALYAAAAYVPAIAASIGTSDDAAGSVDYRSRLLDAGLRLIRENWLTGLDVATILDKLSFLRTGEQFVDLVNMPMVVVMRAGIFGAVAYFAIFFRVLVLLFTRAPRLEPIARATGAACFAGLVGLMAALTTTSLGRNETTYIMLLAVGAGVLSRRVVRLARHAEVRSNLVHEHDIGGVHAHA